MRPRPQPPDDGVAHPTTATHLRPAPRPSTPHRHSTTQRAYQGSGRAQQPSSTNGRGAHSPARTVDSNGPANRKRPRATPDRQKNRRPAHQRNRHRPTDHQRPHGQPQGHVSHRQRQRQEFRRPGLPPPEQNTRPQPRQPQTPYTWQTETHRTATHTPRAQRFTLATYSDTTDFHSTPI